MQRIERIYADQIRPDPLYHLNPRPSLFFDCNYAILREPTLIFNQEINMRKIVSIVIVVMTCAAAVSIRAKMQKDDGFKKYYAEFQAAVKADDKEKVASLIRFDKFTWEASPELQKIKTKEEFLKNYPKIFTPTIKTRIATGKLESSEGNYFIIWQTKNSEYSLYFAHFEDGSYGFLGLTIGPR
jgi:hypothetical protein